LFYGVVGPQPGTVGQAVSATIHAYLDLLAIRQEFLYQENIMRDHRKIIHTNLA
jgi:hypothetical protein